jgi:predicted metal-dependent peptidase
MNAAVNAETDLQGLSMRERVAHFRMMTHQYAPYLSSYVYSLVMVERPGIGTMAVDKYGRMYFDPAFVDTLTLEQGGYVVLHEAWHLILRHCHRSKDIIGATPTRLQRERLNVAYDVVIWELMEAIAHHAPQIEGGSCITYPLMKERYPALERNLSPQEIYNIISEQDDAPPPEEPGQPGDEEQDDEQGDEEGGDFHQPSEDDEEFDPDTESEDSGDDSDEDCERSEEDSDEGEPGEENDDGDGDESSDDGDEEADGEGEDQGDDDYGDFGTPVEDDKPSKRPAYEDLTRIGDGSCADNEPREYEEPPNPNWDTFIEDQLLEDVERRIEEQESRPWQPGIGNVPGCLKETIRNKLRPQPDPWAKLRAVAALAASTPRGAVDYTYSRPNRRQHSMPAGSPLLKSQRKFAPKAVVIVDTSGSMTTLCKVKALNVIAQGLRALGDFPVICGDMRVQSDTKVSKLTDQFEMPGGGGTDMVMLIEYAIEKHNPTVIVLATDGGTGWPSTKIKPQLIIALTQDLPTPEWATTCYIPDEGKEVTQ